MANILVIEDDIILNKGLSFGLKKDNHTIFSAFTKEDGIQIFNNNNNLDIIILDINLPDGNGEDVCKFIRKSSNVPIIFLTAKDTEDDVIRGFKEGCDDYITKPFSIEILKQRVLAVIRRSNFIEDKNKYTYKELSIDFDKRIVKIKDEEVKLTSTEYKLLELLIKNRKQVLTRTMILENLWDIDGNFIDENTLNVHIRRLRKKIEPDLKNLTYIITVFGVGYTFGEE